MGSVGGKQIAARISGQLALDNLSFLRQVPTMTESDATYTELPSGLKYREITEGKGDKPTAKSMVTVHYEGTFEDGEVFESSQLDMANVGLIVILPSGKAEASAV